MSKKTIEIYFTNIEHFLKQAKDFDYVDVKHKFIDKAVIEAKNLQQALAELRRMNVTHIWVDWRELFRLSTSYGFPASLSAELVERARANRPAGMKLFDLLGLRVASEIERLRPTTAPAEATWWETWPLVTVYALPWAPTTAPTTSPAAAPSAPVR